LGTTVTGTVNATTSGEVQMTVQTFDGRGIALFNFAGTGASGNDADPVNYQVATGALSLAGISAATPVHVRGFVHPYGQAPSDFDAVSIVNVAATPALLLSGWEPATTAPFAGSSAA